MGKDAKQSGVKKLFTIGTNSRFTTYTFGDNAIHFEDINALQHRLQQELSHGITCLIKGSRFMGLDKLADILTDVGEG